VTTLEEAAEHLAADRLVEGRRAAEKAVREATRPAEELAAWEVLCRAHLFQNARLDAAGALSQGRSVARSCGDEAAELRFRLLGVEVSLAGQRAPRAELDAVGQAFRGRPEGVVVDAMELMAAALDDDVPEAVLQRALKASAAPTPLALRALQWVVEGLLRVGRPDAALRQAHAGMALAEAVGHEAWRARFERLAKRAEAEADPAAQEAVIGLVELASATSGLRDVRGLLRQICEATLQLLDVDRAFVVLRDQDGSLRVAAGMARPGVEPGQPSRHIASRAVRTGRPVVSNDLEHEPGARSASIIAMGLRSVICAPMAEGDHVFGAIYGDSERVTEHELRQVAWLARGVAGVAAVAVANARRLDRAEKGSQEGRERAHDVRNLLNLVALASEDIAEADDVPAWARELSGRSARAARQMQGHLQRLIAPSTDVLREPVELGSFTRELHELLEREARESRVELALTVGREAWVRADPDELGRALTNLLVNALKYAPSGSVVEVAVGGGEGRATWSVRDRGPGVPDDELERIFAPGHQARGAQHGHGLGLGIAKRIVQAHQGTVRATHAEGGGARFEVSLPLHDAPG